MCTYEVFLQVFVCMIYTWKYRKKRKFKLVKNETIIWILDSGRNQETFDALDKEVFKKKSHLCDQIMPKCTH